VSPLRTKAPIARRRCRPFGRHRLRVVTLVAPSASDKVGTVVEVVAPRTAGPQTDVDVHDSIDDAAEEAQSRRRGAGVVATASAVRVPAGFGERLRIVVGRVPRPGETPRY